MRYRWFLAFNLAAFFAAAQISPRVVSDVPDAELEAAHQTRPDDLQITGRLLNFYARDNRDSAWSARFTLLSQTVQGHPDASLLSAREVYGNMPQPLRDQLRQVWIAQVQLHPDNSRILRNASVAMESPSQPTTIRVGQNVQQANLLSKVQPQYPALARQAGVQGAVRFIATVGPEGNVSNLQLESGHPLLVQAAMMAVTQWRYKPTLLNGNPVSVITTIDVTFTLEGVPPNPFPGGQLTVPDGVKAQ